LLSRAFWWESLERCDLGHNLLLSHAFSVGIPLTMGFRPQLVVVSGLFVGNPYDGGILGFHGVFGYHKAFSQTFPLSQWNSGYHGAFSRIFLSHDGISAIKETFHEFFFHMMESWLSQSLFTNFSFTRWNLGYQGAFSRIFLSHDGISAIKEPFHEFFFHTMESRLLRSLSLRTLIW
jgi:hypothetical protein